MRAAAEDTRAPDRVRVAVAPDLPLIRADAGQLRRAVANLLENALRYGDGEPVSVRARVSGGRILMRVVDQGPGIPPSEHERILAPFYRAPGSGGGQGSGLGLAIVRGLIEANGSRVRVESLPGQGSSFVEEGDDVAEVAARVARERGTTYVLMGTPAPRSPLRRFSEPLPERLVRLLPGVDVRIVADRSKREWSPR